MADSSIALQVTLQCKVCGNPPNLAQTEGVSGMLACGTCPADEKIDEVLGAMGYRIKQAISQHIGGSGILVDDAADPLYVRSNAFRIRVACRLRGFG